MYTVHRFGIGVRRKEIEYLIRKKLPYMVLDNSGDPKFTNTAVNVDYQMNLFNTYLDELNSLSDDDLKKLYDHEKDNDRKLYQAQINKEEQEFLSRFKAEQECFEHYSRFDQLSIEEIIALVLGLNPKKATYEKMQHYKSSQTPTALNYFKYIDLAVRKFKKIYSSKIQESYHVSTSYVKTLVNTMEVIEWAISRKIRIDPGFITALQLIVGHRVSINAMRQKLDDNALEIEQLKKDLATAKESLANASLATQTTVPKNTSPSGLTKKINSLQKLALGMAMAKYEYDPLSVHNPATGNKTGSIPDDIQCAGKKLEGRIKGKLDLNEETVRGVLKEAFDQLQ